MKTSAILTFLVLSLASATACDAQRPPRERTATVLSKYYFDIDLPTNASVQSIEDKYVSEGRVRRQGSIRMRLQLPDSSVTRILRDWSDLASAAVPDTGLLSKEFQDIFPGIAGRGFIRHGSHPDNFMMLLVDRGGDLHLFRTQLSDVF